MPETIISRVYDLKIAGYDDSLVKVKALTVAFGKMDATKKKLNEQLQKKLNTGDVTAIKELSARIKELEGNMSNLSAKRDASAKELLLQAQAEKNLAAAEKTRMANIIQQEKELDRLIAKEEKQNNVVNQSTGYYYDLLAAQKVALQLYRQTQPDSPLYEQIKKGAIDAKAKVDAFNRSLSPDGTLVGEYKTGILNAFKNLGLSDVLKKQSNDINSQLNKLKEESRQLATEYKKTADSGSKSFAEVEHQLKNNLEQQEKLKQSLTNLDTALKGTGNIGAQITAGISSGFKDAKRQVGQLVLGYVGFQAIFSGLRSGVGIAKELSDQTTNLEIEFGKAAGGADKIVEALSKLKTRTKLTVLEDMAFIAAKAGVSEEKIVGVTQAIDKIKIAFGKDFGDVEQGTEDLIKLINVFEGTENVTGDNLLKTGNAVRVLANESVASVPYLNDFSKRMAGLKGISNIALPAVLGLASGFEQFGQSSEVAGTTLTKVIPKLGTDTEKYARIAGLTQQAFSDLLKNDPAEALIKVSESLVKGQGDIEEISKAFADSQLGSGRIAAILGTVGAKADEFRKSIHSAGVAYKDTGNIETAFADKNKNLASQLDKISKAFSDAANSKAFQGTIAAISGLVLLLINNLPALITIIGLYATGWALANKQMIIAKAELIFQRTMLPILTFLFGGHANAMKAYAIATQLASKALAGLTKLMGNPVFKIFAVGIGLSLIALTSFGKAINNTVGALDKYAQKQKFINEINSEASKSLSEIKIKEEILLGIIKDRTLADETRAKALENLKTLMGEYGKDLTLETILTNKGTEALKAFNAQLLQKAKNTAAAAIAERENAKLSQLIQVQSDIATAKRSGGSISTANLPNEFVDKFYDQQGRSASKIGKFLGDKVGIDFTYSGKDLDAFANLVKTEIDKQVAKTSGAELAKIEVENKTKVEADVKKLNDNPVKVKPVEIDIETLKKDIEEYDKRISEFKGSQAALNKLLDDRKKLQAKLDAAMGTDKTKADKPYRGSRLTGEQRDAVKDIEAARDEQIAVEKLKFARLETDEETYLRKILKINEDAANAKLRLLKGKNAEERKQIAELQLYKIDQEAGTNKALFDLAKKELDRNFDAAKRESQNQVDKVKDDPTKTEQDKRRETEAFLSAQYISQFVYNQKVEALEKKYGQRSLDETKKRHDTLADLEKSYNKNNLEITVGTLEDIEKATEDAIVKIKLKYDKLREEILKSNKSSADKNNAISLVGKVENVEVGGVQQKGNNDSVEAARKLLEAGLITSKQFEEIYAKAIKGQQDLNAAIEEGKTKLTTVKALIGGSLGKLFGFEEGSDAAKALGEIITQAFDVAGQAMNTYFDNEQQQIERSKQIAQQRLNIELNQAKSRAQSKAEEDSLDRQFAAKKEKANREAFEKDKKLKKQQLIINYAIQLANIAVAASANPLNALTFGAAGIAQYIIQAAIASVAFGINLNSINKSQYAGGGKVTKPTKVKNGRITETPNIPTQPNGDNIFATVRTNEVILNEEQQRRLGGPAVFKSIGVPGFASGGYTGDMSSFADLKISDRLKPPINPSSFLNRNSQNSNPEEMRELKSMVAETTATILQVSKQTNERIDKIKVINVARETEKVNNDLKKASNIGTI